jgi:asparagine synthase (glutamine-hydrolysing)
MCGIAGLYDFTRQRAADADTLKTMCDVIHHRGPDDEGRLVDGALGIGMRRLSIIDLAGGHQPVHNEDRTVWVVLNGEIYNYRQLRSELEDTGHRFYTQSDTETLVHLYEQHGEDFVRRLNGMFCFALWDARRKCLLLGRDQIGEKQLYYCLRDGQIAFGSEIKCVLASGLPSRDIDPGAIDLYLTYLYTPAPATVYRDIVELPPAHTLSIAAGTSPRLSRYWELSYPVDRSMSLDEAVQGFNEHFREAVVSRLVSDVPVGALLSGGIDSSAIVAVMAESGNGRPRTYCIGYDDAAYYDERRYAALVARRFGTEHHEFVVKPDVVSAIGALLHAFDQPFADSSAVVNHYVFRETRKHVTVVLSGLGGDEVAAGYERYLGVEILQQYGRLPRWVREGFIERLVAILPDSRQGGRLIERIKRFVRTGALPIDQAYFAYLSAFTRKQKSELYSEAMQAALAKSSQSSPEEVFERAFSGIGVHDALNRCLENDRRLYLPGDLLVLADRTSMANSIEARAPFLDIRLIQFMATVPTQHKLHGRSKKHLLKQALRGRLPDEILFRRKQGFSLPLTLWLRNELNPYLRRVLARERIERAGLLQWPAVSRLIEEHSSGRENHHGRLWSLIMLMNWHEQCHGEAAIL